MKLLSDLEILDAIYSRYYHEFAAFVKGAPDARNVKVYVPIDIDKIGEDLNVDGDIVFGRLYYHFNKKYCYEKGQFFARELGPTDRREIHCIQFPLMASVLAELKYENRKYNVATSVSILSFIVAVIALVVSFFK